MGKEQGKFIDRLQEAYESKGKPIEEKQRKFMDKMWKTYGGKEKPKRRVTEHGTATEISPRRIIDYINAVEDRKE